MTHTAQQISAFTDGETRLVYARDRDAPLWAAFFYLEDGTVTNEVRTYTRDHLICVVPGCTSRGLAVHARSTKRDGFVHLGGSISASHTEGIFHQQGKAALLRWVRERYPHLDVRAEVDVRDGPDIRRADVLVTFPTGERVALEVQYEGMSVDQWTKRHESYQRLGIVDVWLFGHTGRQMPLRGVDVYPNEVHRAVVAAGQPLLWLNPLLDKIATAQTVRHPITAPMFGTTHRVLFTDNLTGVGYSVPAHDGPASLLIDDLHDTELTPNGLETPGIRALRASEESLAAVDAARQVAIEETRQTHLAALAAQEEQERAARREAALIAARERERIRTLAVGRSSAVQEVTDRAQAAHAANETAARQALQEAAGARAQAAREQVIATYGSVPPFLEVRCADIEPAISTYWQWEAYRTLVRRRVGGSVSLYDTYKHVAPIIGHGTRTGQAVRTWLNHMSGAGLLTTKDKVHYVIEAQPDPAVPAPGAPRSATTCVLCRQPLHRDTIAAGDDKHSVCPIAAQTIPTQAPRRRTSKLCKGCAYPLEPGATSRYHADCEPWRRNAARHEMPARH